MRVTYCNLVLDSTRHNDVCDISLRFYEFVKVGLDEGEPLFYTTLDVASTMGDISENLRLDFVSSFKSKTFRMSYVFLKDRGQDQLQRKSLGLTCQAPSDHVTQRSLPK